jgi:Domain of unknown function (DUF6431)
LTGQGLECVAAVAGIRYSFPVEILQGDEGPALESDLCKVPPSGRAPFCTIVFISLSAAQSKLEADWAEPAEGIIRRCPVCLRNSVVGHGRRRKQAHDEEHDWITIRRGICHPCGKTITFLPAFSLPYSHYSLITRSEALRRFFVERCSWEKAAPPVKDPHRIADPSTLRRWFQSLDCSRSIFSSLRRTLQALDQWLRGGQAFRYDHWDLSWRTVYPFLHCFWPLRI